MWWAYCKADMSPKQWLLERSILSRAKNMGAEEELQKHFPDNEVVKDKAVFQNGILCALEACTKSPGVRTSSIYRLVGR